MIMILTLQETMSPCWWAEDAQDEDQWRHTHHHHQQQQQQQECSLLPRPRQDAELACRSHLYRFFSLLQLAVWYRVRLLLIIFAQLITVLGSGIYQHGYYMMRVTDHVCFSKLGYRFSRPRCTESLTLNIPRFRQGCIYQSGQGIQRSGIKC